MAIVTDQRTRRIAERIGSAEEAPRPSVQDSEPSATGPPEPRTFGYDGEEMNRVWAFVLLGAKDVVFFERPRAKFEDKKRFLSVGAFERWHANRFTEIIDADGKVKCITWAKRWLTSRERRSYEGIEFFPDVNNAPGSEGYLNLWSGFSVRPRNGGVRSYKTFYDHLLTNVCGGNEEHFRWVFGFFAHMVQRPRERIGVALVLRGAEGAGKTKVGEVIGSLFSDHYFLVDDARYVTGNFNAHMATCLLLQADEAVWAGDKAAESRIKGLITSPFQQIEHKGIDPIRLPNYVRLLLTSNETWVVPAGHGARRWGVFDVDKRCVGNYDYFREMDVELDRGGREALLADLLAFDLSSVDLRTIPKTAALLEQKVMSLPPIDSWWYGRLQSGSITRDWGAWPEKKPKREIEASQLYGDYIAVADRIGVRRKSEETAFGMRLKKLVPGLSKALRQYTDDAGNCRRYYVYELPSLEEAREYFVEVIGQPIEWD